MCYTLKRYLRNHIENNHIQAYAPENKGASHVFSSQNVWHRRHAFYRDTPRRLWWLELISSANKTNSHRTADSYTWTWAANTDNNGPESQYGQHAAWHLKHKNHRASLQRNCQ